MTDKELNQIEAWLSGQGRYKLFDAERLDILRALTGNEFKVWFYLWTQERMGQESWPSLSTLVEKTGLTENTVIKIRKRLKERRWVWETGQTAADKYDSPTRGAHKVKVIRVDDPSKIAPAKPAASKIAGAEIAPANVYPPKIEDNVSIVSAFVVASTGTIGDAPASTCTGKPSILPSEEDENQTPKQPRPRSTLESAAKWLSRYSEAKPVDFETWSQVDRTHWCIEHDRSTPVKEPRSSSGLSASRAQHPKAQDELVPVDIVPVSASLTPPPPQAPPSPPEFTCPVTGCEYRSEFGYGIAEHIQEKHSELGQQSFRINCPKDGCSWGAWWNKIDGNRAKKEADLNAHLEAKHDPTSPRYEPQISEGD